MGVILNPRGTSGAGKTEFVRRVLADYGWGGGGRVEKLHRDGRERPIAYRLRHPRGGRPLATIGHYEGGSCGGCDTIRADEGGLDEALRLAEIFAASGHDVLLEGLMLSRETERSAALAQTHPLHVLKLATPQDRCVRHLIRRRNAGRGLWPRLARKVEAEAQALDAACERLRGAAHVVALDFDDALLRARNLLGLTRETAA